MKRVLGLMTLLFLLGACAPAAPDCAWASAFGGPTATPLVAAPTAKASGVQPETCPTRTPRPTLDPPPTPTAGPGLGQASSAARPLTLSPQDKQIAGVYASAGRGAVVVRQDGRLRLIIADTWKQFDLGLGEAASVAFRADGFLAVAVLSGSTLVIRQARFAGELESATPIDAPVAGADPVLGFGPDGWPYLAAAGQVARLNPESQAWEAQGSYTGQARQIARTASGALLLLTDAGLLRKALGATNWSPAWTGVADGLAVRGDDVALAWHTGREWLLTVSGDGGANWDAPQAALRSDACDCALGAFPLWGKAGALDVASVLVELPGGDGQPHEGDVGDHGHLPEPGKPYPFPALVRRTAGGWYPPLGSTVPEALVRNVTDIQPVRALRCASDSGASVCAWEAIGFNGQVDILAITR